MKELLFTALKGAWVGGTLTVPGVSGGSMAMILGVYEKLILSVNVFLKKGGDKKGAFKFLCTFGIGAVLGMIALSGVVVSLMEMFPTPMVFFFAGAVAGGVPVILYEIKDEKPKFYDVIYLAVGIAITVGLSKLPEGLFTASEDAGIGGILLQVLGGFITAAALVLPGISVSHMLYVLGLYTWIMTSVSSFDVLPLIPFGIGVLLGVVTTSGAMEFLMKKFKKQTYLVILGFVGGSVVELLSHINPGEFSFVCIPLLVAGFALIFALFYIEQRKNKVAKQE